MSAEQMQADRHSSTLAVAAAVPTPTQMHGRLHPGKGSYKKLVMARPIQVAFFMVLPSVPAGPLTVSWQPRSVYDVVD